MKGIYTFFATILAITIIIFAYFTDNTGHKDFIIAEDYFGKYTLSIPLSVSNAHSYEFLAPYSPKQLKETIFYSPVTVDDLYSIIEKKQEQFLLNGEPREDYDVTIFPADNSVNIKLSNEERIICFSIAKTVPKSRSAYYRFFNMGFNFYEKTDDPYGYDIYDAETVLLPVFFIDDQSMDGEICFFDTDYKISCCPEQFIEFYKEMGVYDIAVDEEGYILTLRTSKIKQTKPLKLIFSSVENEKLFRITEDVS